MIFKVKEILNTDANSQYPWQFIKSSSYPSHFERGKICSRQVLHLLTEEHKTMDECNTILSAYTLYRHL